MTKHRTGYLFKRGGNYYVRTMIEGKVVVRVLRDEAGNTISTVREAKAARERFMKPLLLGDKAEALQSLAGALSDGKAELAALVDAQNPALPFSQAWAEFIASPNRPDSGAETLYQYECQYSALVDWIKEKHPAVATLRGVSKEIAEEYAGHLNHGRLSANTYNKHLNLLTLVFRVLKGKAKLAENYWQDIQRKRLVTHSRRELTIDELRNVCQTASGELRSLLAIGVYSGLRLGDCATLRWGEVDLPRNLIRRIPNKTARRNPKPVIVPVHPVLRDMLALTPVASRGDYVLPEMATLYQNRTDLVTDRVQAHFIKCGIKPHKHGTGKNGKRAVIEVGFHSLRHTFVSLCRDSNAPLSVVESIVGHNSPAMTRHYTHVGELAAGRAVAALPSVMENLPAQVQATPEAILREARAIADSITAQTWPEKKAALQAILPA